MLPFAAFFAMPAAALVTSRRDFIICFMPRQIRCCADIDYGGYTFAAAAMPAAPILITRLLRCR